MCAFLRHNMQQRITEHRNGVLHVTPLDNKPTDSLRINDLVALCSTYWQCWLDTRKVVQSLKTPTTFQKDYLSVMHYDHQKICTERRNTRPGSRDRRVSNCCILVVQMVEMLLPRTCDITMLHLTSLSRRCLNASVVMSRKEIHVLQICEDLVAEHVRNCFVPVKWCFYQWYWMKWVWYL